MPSKKVKAAVAERASHICEYCICPLLLSSSPFSVEHIIPLAKNGSDDIDNLALACQGCNNFKYALTEAIDSITGEYAPLYNPRKDKWNEHFTWSDDFIELLGISPIGRATISKLKLNREGVKNQRKLLKIWNLHPPKN
ncbi:MAG: HNH endonuclease signature motif containing protein [Bacteroidota bacterium]